MADRDLYLAAYDVADNRRLSQALHTVRAFATGGQKSVHEVFLTAGEKGELLKSITGLLDHTEDRFFLLRLDPRAKCHALGIAIPPSDASYFYVG